MSSESRATILWADDEIEFLRSHILFLEDKGYKVVAVNSGEDAFDTFKKSAIDLILLDEMMTGMDGLETLKKIKGIQPEVPIIMITKNEEEWLMEEAIASQINNYLIKPVNPTQIFMACKNILEKREIRIDHISKEYVSSYQESMQDMHYAECLTDWFGIYDNLCNWIVKFDEINDPSLKKLLSEQYNEADKLFSHYISDSYSELISGEDKKFFTPYTIQNNIEQNLRDGKKNILIIMDCLRSDQWKSMTQNLYRDFNINTDYQLSIIPSTTFYSRNAIFSGFFPDDLSNKESAIYSKMIQSEKNYNKYEHELLKNQLSRLKLGNISTAYVKVSSYEFGKSLAKSINDYKNIDLLCIVVNFIDILAHSRSESGVLKEVLTDEASYRDIICSWISNSWFREVVNQIGLWDREIFVTSDHGSTMVKKPIQIKAYKDVSSGVRYKIGKNLKVNKKYALRITDLSKYKLPQSEMNENCLIALDNNYFVFPNNFNQYSRKLDNTFQHGGMSMNELIVPIASMRPK